MVDKNDFDFRFDVNDENISSSTSWSPAGDGSSSLSNTFDTKEYSSWWDFPKWCYGICLLLIVVLCYFGFSRFLGASGFQDDLRITLRGRDVSQLSLQTPVTMNKTVVGLVERKQEGEAEILIYKKYATKVTSNSSFSINSSNDWFPDQSVVRITPGDTNLPRLRVGTIVNLNESLLPATIPWRFILLCIMAFTAVTIAIAIWFRIVYKIVVLVVFLAILLAVTYYCEPEWLTEVVSNIQAWLTQSCDFFSN